MATSVGGAQFDRDGLWKDGARRRLRSFLAWIFPALERAIHCGHKPQFLPEEFRPAGRRRGSRKRQFVDLLFRYVPLATPRRREIARVEVQGQRQRTFGRRMDRYRSLIRAEYDLPLSQGALLTDESRQWRPTTYREATSGGSVEVTFTATKLLAWEGQEADPETTENEWAQVLLAFLLGRRHRRSETRRLEAKLRITQRLLEKGLEKAEVEPLVGLVDSYLPSRTRENRNSRTRCVSVRRQRQCVTSLESSESPSVKALSKGSNEESNGESHRGREWDFAWQWQPTSADGSRRRARSGNGN